MILSIVIPALNEEKAIGSIIKRTMAAADGIISRTPVTEVEVIVVSDGSSDKTADIAFEFVPKIKLISYKINRGYGAAIKLGFLHSKGDLVAFLDADGTCDPEFFTDLVNILEKEKADIALGNRMTDKSKMPIVRKIGNSIFALTINLIASTQISDSASGMRVLRKSSLEGIYPLPDGLHFTPAMSCRAALDQKLKMVELPMPYAERTGLSKLSAVRDGVMFIKIIFDIALTYRPFRIFGSLGLLLMIVMGLFGAEFLFTYFSTGKVHDGMIFRAMAIIVLGVSGLIAFSLGMLSERATQLIHQVQRPHGAFYRFFRNITDSPKLFWMGVILIAIAFLFAIKPSFQYFTMGKILIHWSQLALSGFCFLFGMQVIALSALDRIFITLLEKECDVTLEHHDPEQIFGG